MLDGGKLVVAHAGMKAAGVAGEVLAGLILGPTVLNFLHWEIFTNTDLEETFTFLAELGVLLGRGFESLHWL